MNLLKKRAKAIGKAALMDFGEASKPDEALTPQQVRSAARRRRRALSLSLSPLSPVYTRPHTATAARVLFLSNARCASSRTSSRRSISTTMA